MYLAALNFRAAPTTRARAGLFALRACILVEKGRLDMDMRRLTLVTSNVSDMSHVLFAQKTTYVAGAFSQSGPSHRPPLQARASIMRRVPRLIFRRMWHVKVNIYSLD
jgi:hypothetical protein